MKTLDKSKDYRRPLKTFKYCVASRTGTDHPRLGGRCQEGRGARATECARDGEGGEGAHDAEGGVAHDGEGGGGGRGQRGAQKDARWLPPVPQGLRPASRELLASPEIFFPNNRSYPQLNRDFVDREIMIRHKAIMEIRPTY